MNNDILLAYKMNNVTLPPERGFPFQVVAEDKWGYKWVKWVTKIEISGDPNYKGYWESNGYDNNGDITG
jgi:DMSO/TMAO reductase YedYZ molybdopterin-dependent catalytic subunit